MITVTSRFASPACIHTEYPEYVHAHEDTVRTIYFYVSCVAFTSVSAVFEVST